MKLKMPVCFVGFAVLSFLSIDAGWGFESDGANQEPFKFFREYAGLNEGQIASIRQGKAFAKVMDSPDADEVFIFGAVYIQVAPERYLEFASDIENYRKLPSYLAIQKLSDPPQLSDLEGLTLEEDDIKHLKDCKPGRCDVQLPAETMGQLQLAVNWNAPDSSDQVNRFAQQAALQAILSYMKGGNGALGIYRDKSHPSEVATTFATLAGRAKALPVYLPELNQYLLDYPKANSDNIESQFYWEKVNFGLKPTVRVVQAIVYRGKTASDPAYAVAVKQLYASHYFEGALDLTVCVRDSSKAASSKGFYLITMKGSQQAGLTGLKGSIVRKVAVDKSRSSLERALASMKQKLENPGAAN